MPSLCEAIYTIKIMESVFGPAFKARTRINFLHSKWGHFDKARSKFQSSLCDYVHCPPSAIIWVWGGRGMGVILSLYVPGMFRGVWKNVLTLNVFYTDLSSLWMPGRTHYTHVCILCPHFECRARYVCGGVCVGGVYVCVCPAMRFVMLWCIELKVGMGVGDGPTRFVGIFSKRPHLRSKVIQGSICLRNVLWLPDLVRRTPDQSVVHSWGQMLCRGHLGSTRGQIA